MSLCLNVLAFFLYTVKKKERKKERHALCDGLNGGEIRELLLFSISVFPDRWVWNDKELHMPTLEKTE